MTEADEPGVEVSTATGVSPARVAAYETSHSTDDRGRDSLTEREGLSESAQGCGWARIRLFDASYSRMDVCDARAPSPFRLFRAGTSRNAGPS
jgi:hypothetical protein